MRENGMSVSQAAKFSNATSNESPLVTRGMTQGYKDAQNISPAAKWEKEGGKWIVKKEIRE
jgi:hypothetical protein